MVSKKVYLSAILTYSSHKMILYLIQNLNSLKYLDIEIFQTSGSYLANRFFYNHLKFRVLHTIRYSRIPSKLLFDKSRIERHIAMKTYYIRTAEHPV